MDVVRHQSLIAAACKHIGSTPHPPPSFASMSLLVAFSRIGHQRHERAVDDFSTALNHLKPNTEPRRASPYEEAAASEEQKQQTHFSEDIRCRRNDSSPGAHGEGTDYDGNGLGASGQSRSVNLATNASERVAKADNATIHYESSTTIPDSKNQEYGYGGNNPGGPIGGGTAGEEDGHHRADRGPLSEDVNASGRVSRGYGDGKEDGMVEWGSVSGACHYAR